jgi:hypothetical protein
LATSIFRAIAAGEVLSAYADKRERGPEPFAIEVDGDPEFRRYLDILTVTRKRLSKLHLAHPIAIGGRNVEGAKANVERLTQKPLSAADTSDSMKASHSEN